MHGDLGRLTDKDLVIVLSHSGSSEEIVRSDSFNKAAGIEMIGIEGARLIRRWATCSVSGFSGYHRGGLSAGPGPEYLDDVYAGVGRRDCFDGDAGCVILGRKITARFHPAAWRLGDGYGDG